MLTESKMKNARSYPNLNRGWKGRAFVYRNEIE